MKIGDIVVRKSYGKDITFKIIDIKNNDEDKIYVLKGINMRIIADSPMDDLEFATKDIIMKKEVTFNKKVNNRIRNILIQRNAEKKYRSPEEEKRAKKKPVKSSKKK
ncbi:sporulation peptidase YabG [Clostridium haemolyticum]|uniref:sporulation peptidase YabG n=1 Tax=Clostridium haemolyticum TaxID=84025 RepID=UPI0026A937D5